MPSFQSVLVAPAQVFAFTLIADVVLLHPVDVCVKVNVVLPPLMPVTSPAFVTDATEGLLLTHVPPEVGDS